MVHGEEDESWDGRRMRGREGGEEDEREGWEED